MASRCRVPGVLFALTAVLPQFAFGASSGLARLAKASAGAGGQKEGPGSKELINSISQFRAEMCAHQEEGQSDEHADCLEFMVKVCNPGPDMLMNGTPGERTTGKGFCTQFFAQHAAHASQGADEARGSASQEAASNAPQPPLPWVEPLPAAPGPAPQLAPAAASLPPEHDRQVAASEEMETILEEASAVVKARPGTASEEKEELAALNWLEDDLAASIAKLDSDAYCQRVFDEAKAVGVDTTSPALADMLAQMRCDMQRMSEPAYTRLLQRKLAEVQRDQKELLRRIEERKRKKRGEPEPSLEPPATSTQPAGSESAAVRTTTPAPKMQLTEHQEMTLLIIGIVACLSCVIFSAFMFGTSKGSAWSTSA